MTRSWHMPTLTVVVLTTLVFMLLLSAAMGLVVRREHYQQLDLAKELAQGQMAFISLIAETELQEGNYEAISSLLDQWAYKHKEIDEIKLISSNGFVIYNYGPHQLSDRRYILNQEILYSYRGRAELLLALSLESAYASSWRLALQMMIVIVLISCMFALLTYLFLSRRREAHLLSLSLEELRDTESRNMRLAAYPRENPNPIAAFDLEGRTTFRNPAFSQLLNTLNTIDPLAVLPDDHVSFLHRIREGEGQLFGEKIVADRNMLAHYHMVDEAKEVYVYLNDITAQRSAEKALRKERNQARTTLASIGDGVITIDMDGRIIYLNVAAAKLCRADIQYVTGKHFSEVVRLMDGDQLWNADNIIARCRISSPSQVVNEEASLLLSEGNGIHVHVSASRIDNQDDTGGIVIVLRDVTREHRLQDELHRQANHDSLTQLMNRSAFESHLERALDSARKRDHEHILCFMDLDQFKVVNDTCGHVAGDELLRQLARVMRKHIRGSDVLARVGGDEFSSILIDCPLPQAIERIDSLREEVQEHLFNWENQCFRVSLSIGIVPINLHSGNIAQLMGAADAACYSAKAAGRNRITIYERDSAATKQRLGEMHWVSHINSALEEERFVLYAQPIVDLDTEDSVIVGVEILLRMTTLDGELIPPGAFLPAAERYDLIERIDYWVIERVMQLLAECDSDYPDCFINLSGATLSHIDIASTLKKMFDKYHINPSKLTFEVTETATIQNLSSAINVIREFRTLGCRFALDDFGSGLSSFGYLKNLPIDFLKIDGMFVKDMNTDPLDKGMVEAIKTVADTMKLTTIAEFVETDLVIEELKKIGINLGQGYGIAHPKPFVEFLSENRDSNVVWLSRSPRGSVVDEM